MDERKTIKAKVKFVGDGPVLSGTKTENTQNEQDNAAIESPGKGSVGYLAQYQTNPTQILLREMEFHGKSPGGLSIHWRDPKDGFVFKGKVGKEWGVQTTAEAALKNLQCLMLGRFVLKTSSDSQDSQLSIDVIVGCQKKIDELETV